MNTEPTDLLRTELDDLRRMSTHLADSLKSCADIAATPAADDLWSERVEAFMSRFARTTDLFKEAIAANRKIEPILNEMRPISQEILLKSAPGIRKKSSRKIIPKGS